MNWREAAIHLIVKQIPLKDSWHKVDSDRCNFHPLMPALTLVYCWKDIWCWKLPCRVATLRNDRLHIYSLWQCLPWTDIRHLDN
jgi:hypothetical protein